MKIKFIPAKTHPQESGQYLWKSCSGDVSLITVAKMESSFGLGNWLGIVDFGGRNVQAFDVEQFSEKLEFVL